MVDRSVMSDNQILYAQLLVYIAKKYGIIPLTASEEEYTMHEIYEARMCLLEQDIVAELAEYCTANPDDCTDDELAIIANWRHMKLVRGYLMKHQKDYSLLYDDVRNIAYAIRGINQPICDFADAADLPVLIETLLLPVAGGIIWDGLIGSTNVSYGGGMRKILKENMESAILMSGVCEALPLDETRYVSRDDEQDVVAELIEIMNASADYYKYSAKMNLQQYAHAMKYYVQKGAAIEIKAYRKKAKTLGIGGYHIALYGDCVCGVGPTQKTAYEHAQSILPTSHHDDIVVKRIS